MSYKNPLCEEIAAQHKAVDGNVNDMIEFVLRIATFHLRETFPWDVESANFIDPDMEWQE